MALAHYSKWFAVKDAKVAKMLTDPVGGPATYATAVDLPAIKGVSVGYTVETVDLTGDFSLVDTDSILRKLTLSFTFGKESMDARAAIFGGTVSDSGTTPNQIAKWRLLGTDTLFPFFKFEAQAVSVDAVGGDGHLLLYKCKTSTPPPLGMTEDNYQPFTTEAVAVPRIADSFWIDELINETAVAIS